MIRTSREARRKEALRKLHRISSGGLASLTDWEARQLLIYIDELKRKAKKHEQHHNHR